MICNGNGFNSDLSVFFRTSGSFLKNFVLLFYQASIQILGLWQVCLVTKGVMLNFSCTIVLSDCSPVFGDYTLGCKNKEKRQEDLRKSS